MLTDEQRLQRLFDYTKFHIGIYLLAAGAMVTILGSKEDNTLLGNFINHPYGLWAAIVAMAVAGFAGGIIASSCATADSFDEVWGKPIGPWGFCVLRGEYWARMEHTAFWISLALLTWSALM